MSYNFKVLEVIVESDLGMFFYFEDENLIKKLEKFEVVGVGIFYIQFKIEKGCIVSVLVIIKIYLIFELAFEEFVFVCNGFIFGLLKIVIIFLEDFDKLEYVGVDQKFVFLVIDILVKAGIY